jgi:hypothetical protein
MYAHSNQHHIGSVGYQLGLEIDRDVLRSLSLTTDRERRPVMSLESVPCVVRGASLNKLSKSRFCHTTKHDSYFQAAFAFDYDNMEAVNCRYNL